MIIKDNTDQFENKKIEFPVDYQIKLIMDASISDEENKANIIEVLDKLGIPNSDWKSKLSSAGKYISFSIKVHIKDQKQFDRLYNQLNLLKGLKWAV